jgi:hypothetical protein
MPAFGTLSGGSDASGFNLLQVLAAIYPVLTLVLINTTFKDDLSH